MEDGGLVDKMGSIKRLNPELTRFIAKQLKANCISNGDGDKGGWNGKVGVNGGGGDYNGGYSETCGVANGGINTKDDANRGIGYNTRKNNEEGTKDSTRQARNYESLLQATSHVHIVVSAIFSLTHHCLLTAAQLVKQLARRLDQLLKGGFFWLKPFNFYSIIQYNALSNHSTQIHIQPTTTTLLLITHYNPTPTTHHKPSSQPPSPIDQDL